MTEKKNDRRRSGGLRAGNRRSTGALPAEPKTDYRSLFEEAPVGLYRTTPAGEILEANAALVRLLGYPDLQALKKINVGNIENRADRKRMHELLLSKRVVRDYETRLRRYDGEIIWVRDTARAVHDPDGRIRYFEGSLVDVTERKQSAEALRQSHETLLTVLDSIDATIYVADMDTYEILFMNKYMQERFGYNLVGEICWKVFRGESAPCPHCTNAKLLDMEGKPSGVCVWEGRNPLTGQWYVNYDRAIKWVDGRFVRLQVATDISEIKAAEEALQRQKRYLDALHETSLDIIGRLELHELLQAIIARAGALVDTRHGFIYLYDSNEDVLVMRVGVGRHAAAEGFRLKPGEGLAGKVWRTGQARVVADYNAWPGRSLKFGTQYADLKAAIGIPLKSGDQLAGVIGLGYFNPEQQFGEDEITILTRFAELASIALDNARLYSRLREEFAEHRRTQEERRKLEAQLRQAQKMEAIGTLAGGVAHNFNNLLMGIQGRTSLMLLDIDPENPHFEHLKGIEEDVKSAAELTRQLLGLARGGKYEAKPTDLNELIAGTTEIFGRTKKEISIHAKYEQNIWTVEVDRAQIEQVMLNLYINAWQAMPGGGDLYLETGNVTLEKSEVAPYQGEPGRYVKILVTDTGEGMDEVTRQKIFEPFFTTKEKESGTGLGLASAYGIIRNHGGIINVDSQTGIGTSFTIHLPVSDKVVTAEPQKHDNLLRGGETVLVVDDEPMIVQVGSEMLQKLGYRVMTALGGKEGLRLYRDKQDQIDLVILDMVMPDLSGEETFKKLLELNPQVRVLLSSGYSLDGRADKILKKGCAGFIQKPFNINELSQSLRNILG